ncbi:hypothetical protein EJ04DRAFT_438619 [Polyplosphaeria fusca]|uniref:Uncharacterized protein n=1 Tax=Polyplosphaeria fusca TaxID=682080 RepID=A0A9P4QTU8_9PLEO|nr:hypothetical protein EJ04DRAFT_438619 [Polyplosphaeria fusca]
MAQPVLAQFWPIFPHRSDGREQLTTKGIVMKNGPNAKQLDQTPNAQGQADYYRLIAKDEPKHIDWRKKLGGMLLRQIGGKQYEGKLCWTQCILWDLPEGYRLYEHIKSKVDGQTKPVKNHSGGGHDRQDAYLYGHPKGPKKRFRSPVEFFPHLLWLSTDEGGDYDNCACKLCCPVQLETEKPAPKAEAHVNSPVVKQENDPAASPISTSIVHRHPIVQNPVRNTNTQPPAAAQSPNAPRIRLPPSLTPSQPPHPRSQDQQLDSEYNKFLCRTGEVVWFFRQKTRAWGLGLIVRRWIPKDKNPNRAHVIQPLSHPHASPAAELVVGDDGLKPWLAWSAPGCTHKQLQILPNLRYDQVDWHAVLAGSFGEGEPEVDASILAAKAVDASYTTFEPLKTTTNNSGHEERHWNGIFFGAEKIWNGDPVRMRIGSGTDIMVVTNIVERIVPTAANGSSRTSTIQLHGDVYTYATFPAPDPSKPPDIPQSTTIPIRMREDMRWRNNFLIPATRTIAYWKLISTQSRLELSDIKGRWYETSLIFVESFHKAVRNNEGGNGIWMNTRGDAAGITDLGTRVAERVKAFGRAIPDNTLLMDGLDPPAEPEQAPQGNNMQGLEMPAADANFHLGEFMHLDGMDEGHMGFGDNFHFH